MAMENEKRRLLPHLLPKSEKARHKDRAFIS
jgi:hypothetical protein